MMVEHPAFCKSRSLQAGAIVVAGLISPYAADRDYAREVTAMGPHGWAKGGFGVVKMEKWWFMVIFMELIAD